VHAGFPDLQGHYILIRALFASYNYIPVGTGVFGEDMVNDIVRVLEHISDCFQNQCTYYHINNDKRGGTGNCFKNSTAA